MKIHTILFVWGCSQTDKQTDMQTGTRKCKDSRRNFQRGKPHRSTNLVISWYKVGKQRDQKYLIQAPHLHPKQPQHQQQKKRKVCGCVISIWDGGRDLPPSWKETITHCQCAVSNASLAHHYYDQLTSTHYVLLFRPIIFTQDSCHCQ